MNEVWTRGLRFLMTTGQMDVYMAQFTLFFLTLFVVDVVLQQLTSWTSTTRWYLIHSLGNIAITLVCFAPALEFITDPVLGLKIPIRFDVSAVYVASLHVYHLLAFSCTLADWLHHLAFVVTGTAVQYIWGESIGGLAAFYHMHICGYPGAMDYFMLALVGMGKMTKETRIRCAVEINTWIRGPGLLISASFAYLWLTLSPWDTMSVVGACLMIFVSAVNAQFYTRQVCLAAGRKYKMD